MHTLDMYSKSMAKTIDTYQFKPRRGTATINWEELFNGQIWVLTPGEDFTAKSTSFKNSAQTKARELGVKVLINIEEDGTVVLQKQETEGE